MDKKAATASQSSSSGTGDCSSLTPVSLRPEGAQATRHWLAQRATSIALIPLLIWLVASFFCRRNDDYAQLALWMSSPLNGALLLLAVGTGLAHAHLGLRVVIEDYIHHPLRRLIISWGTTGVLWLAAVVALVSVIKLVLIASFASSFS